MDSFRTAASIALGGLIGILVVLPFLPQIPDGFRIVSFVVFPLLGMLSGYRRRASSGFFYFSLFAVLALLTLLLTQSQSQ